jgi:Flp pilus assembly protein TadB
MHHDIERSDSGTNWASTLKLACVASIFSALCAMLLVGHVAETTIIVVVIVGATLASWYQLEHHTTTNDTRLRQR